MEKYRRIPFLPVLLAVITVTGILAGNLLYRSHMLGMVGTSIDRRITENGTVFDIRDGEDIMWLRKISPDGTLEGYTTLFKDEAGRNGVTVAYHIFAVENDQVYLYRFEQPDASEKLENMSVVVCDTRTWDITPVCDLSGGSDILFTDTVTGGYLYFGYDRQDSLDVYRINPQSGDISEWGSVDAPFPLSWFTVTDRGILYAVSPDSSIYRHGGESWIPVFRPKDTSAIAGMSTGADGSPYAFLMGASQEDSLLRVDSVAGSYAAVKEGITELRKMNALSGDTWIGVTQGHEYRLEVAGQAFTIEKLKVPFRLLWDSDMLLQILLEILISLVCISALYGLYASWRRRNMRLLVKLVAVAVPIFVAGASLIAYVSSNRVTELIYDDVRINLLAGAQTVAERIDSRRFAQIDWNEPFSDDYFLSLRGEVTSLSQALAFDWHDAEKDRESTGHLYINYWIYRVSEGTAYLAVCDNYAINQRLDYYYSAKPLGDGFHLLLEGRRQMVFTPLYSSDDEGNWLSLLYPIYDGERLTAILEVSSPIWNIDHTVRKITGSLLVYSCGVLAAMLAAFMAVLTVSLRTLKKLGRSAAAISGGDYSVRIQDKSTDETGGIARSFNSMAASVESIMADITATRDSYSRFVPGEILSLMHKNSIQQISPSDYIALKAMFMLLTTESFDHYPEQEYIQAMSRFYERILPVLSGSGGVVERFNGRELRALFDCAPEMALDTALSLFQSINRLNTELMELHQKPVECSVLLAYSDTFFGVTGNEGRLNMVLFAKYAYQVNGLREIGLRFGCRLMLDQSAYEALGGDGMRYRHRLLGYILDAGVKCAVYDFYDSETADHARERDMTRENFNRAVDLYYNAQYDGARALFIDILKESPDDFAAREYLKKSHIKLGTGQMPDVLLKV